MKNKNLFRTRWLQVAICTVILIFTPIGNVWGTTSLKGSWDSWVLHEFTYNGSYGYVEVDLAANTTYEFGVQDGGNFCTLQNQTITGSMTDWKLYTGQTNNLKIKSTIAGKYIFIVHYNEGNIISVGYPETKTLYYAYNNSNSYTIKANVRVSSSNEIWRNVEMTSTGKTFDGKTIYKCDVPIYWGSVQHMEYMYYSGSSYKGKEMSINNTSTSSSSFENKIFVSGTTKFKPLGVKRTYDGNTYVYWKTSGNHIPSAWNTGSGKHQIQLLKITDGNYVYSGFQNGEDIGDGFIRYLVPSGEYANILELKGKNNSYSGEFGYSDNAEHNLLWDYNTGGSNIAWSMTYFAKNAYVYLDNTNSNWGTGAGNYNYFMPGRDGTSTVYSMSPISNTHLLCNTAAYSYNDFTEFVFIHTISSWTATESEKPEIRKGYADNRTATLPKLMDYGTKIYNLYTPSDAGAKASTEASLTHSSASTYGGLLNSFQTINTVVKTIGTYVSAQSKAPISLASFELSSATATTASAASLTTSESTDRVSACKTATTTFTVDEENMADGYQFDGWYAAATGGSALQTNVTYSYTTAGARTVYARFSAIDYNVTYSVPTNGNYTIKVASGAASSATKTAIIGQTISISATPVNQAYYFTGWTITNTDASSDVTSTLLPTTSTTASTSFTMPAYNVSITANFAPRFALEGSLYDDSNNAGMPGWVHGSAADFAVAGFTGLGDAGVNLRCTLTTIHPNKKYKFRIYDKERGARLGATSADYLLEANSSVQLSVVGESPANNVVFYSVGYGTYIFHITKLSETNYYPTIEILRQESSQLTLGWKHYTNDALSNGDTGGTVTAATNEGSGYDITNGQFYANGSNLTFTAAPAEGYHVAGWYSDASCETAYVSGSDGATISGVTLELASVSTNKTVYVKFTEDTKEAASGDGGWEAKVGDSKITDVVTISSTITVDVDHAKAKRVILDQSGDGKAGKLVITANKGLEVAEGIWINNGTSLVVPTAEDLVLESSASGNATLIFNNSNSAAASVQMYSIASAPEGETWKWQYAAAPAAVSALYNYYGGYLYKWNGGWQVVHGSDNTELFAGYCVSYPTSGHTFAIEGALAPTDATNQVLNIPAEKEWVVGNSWTAPIQIKQMTAEDFSNVTQTIYLFNTGMDNVTEGVTAGSDNPAAGSYVTIPIANAGEGDLPAVISSLQGFYVKNETVSAGTLTLNYGKHVRPSGGNSIQNGAMHAPKRLQTDDKQVMTITAHGSRFTSRLVLFAHEDYTFGYDAGHDGENINSPGVGPLIYTLREDGTHDDVSAVPEYEGALVGFEAGEDSEYTFKFTYDGDGVWYLNDTKTGLSTLIKNNNTYKFDVSSDDAARFIISATPYNAPAVTTGLNEVESGFARKQMINGVLYVIRDGRIYNAEGAVVK